jgi:polysaccharide deacetylase 2 family uncharacterized protein YibQ
MSSTGSSGMIAIGLAIASGAFAEPPAAATEQPAVSIIIDDMGYRLEEGLLALDLPGPLAYSFLPFAPNVERLVRHARNRDREVLLHLPMEAISPDPPLERGALKLAMTKQELVDAFATSFESVPGAIGVNNHMGSLLTREPLHMGWLMEALNDRGLFFIDSRTTARSVAARVARQHAVPAMTRDVFLDNVVDAAYVRDQFQELLDTARDRGYAVGIAHPQHVTLAALAEELARLDAAGIQLITLRTMLARRFGLHLSEFDRASMPQ